MQIKQKLAIVPYMGKKYEVFVGQSMWQNIVFKGRYFLAHKKFINNFEKFVVEFEKFCEKELRRIITQQIRNLRSKKIKVNIAYKKGREEFFKTEILSVNDFLKKLGYSQELEFRLGAYEKEWGINQINPKQKNFVLFFNKNLIKYDNGNHIEYVVAHELTHVFHRDHGPEFQKSLERLYSRKKQSESFFNKGINQVFGGFTENDNFYFILLLISGFLVIGILYNIWNFIMTTYFNLTTSGF